MPYIGIEPFGQTVRTVTTITATGSQTTFTPTGGYTVGYCDVYYNGIKLVGGTDFTATDGLTVVLTAGATSGAVVEIITYGSVTITDAVRRSGDTFSGAVAINSTLAAGNTTITGNTTTTTLNAGNTTITGTANVSGAATFSNTVSIAGNVVSNVTFSANTTHVGAAAFSNTITVTGNATFSNTVAIGSDYLSPYTGFKNRIINGAMVIDQRNAGASITPTNGQYCVDRWQNAVNVSSKYSCQQVADAPAGFTYSLKATSLSAYTIGAGEIAGFRQYIEGYNIADLGQGTSNATSFTLSFWVKSSLTGTFGGVVSNDNNRTWAFTYTISSASTWEQKTITITGQTGGTWLTTNGIGLSIIFSLACGSTYLTTPAQWNSNNSYGATGQGSVLATNGATWQVTGVQLEKGSTATSFDYRPYSAELAMCQRYYEKSFPASWVPGTASFATGFISTTSSSSSGGEASGARFIVPKRASPTVVTYNAVTGASASAYRVSDGANVSSGPTHLNEGAIGYIAVPINANGYYWHFTASAEL